MVKLVGLDGRENYFPRELSGGQQQRVGIARSLAVEPDIWFLDEPFSALDPLIRKEMQDEFLRLQEKLQKTIMFITHDFDEALKLADRIAIMKDGIIEQLDTPANIVLNPATEYVRKFTEEVPREKVLVIEDVMDTSNKDNLGDLKVSKDEIIENVRAIEYARQLAIYCVRNWRTGNGTPTEPIYTPKYSSLTRYFDDTVITTTALLNADGSANGSGNACNDVTSAIDTLAFLWNDVIANNASGTYLDAAYLISRNKVLIADQALRDTEAYFPFLNLDDTSERKCRRDVRKILDGLIRDLVLGGNDGILTAAESYFTGTQLTGVQEAQRAPTLYAVGRAKLYAIAAMRNWTDGNVLEVTPSNSTYNSTSGELTVSFPAPLIDVSIGDRIAFKEEALNFSCTYNGVTANHPGPAKTDPSYGKSFNISNLVSNGVTTTITCNVGAVSYTHLTLPTKA